jgi:hypothetical protein
MRMLSDYLALDFSTLIDVYEAIEKKGAAYVSMVQSFCQPNCYPG